jgi:hypothetical protein
MQIQCTRNPEHSVLVADKLYAVFGLPFKEDDDDDDDKDGGGDDDTAHISTEVNIFPYYRFSTNQGRTSVIMVDRVGSLKKANFNARSTHVYRLDKSIRCITMNLYVT